MRSFVSTFVVRSALAALLAASCVVAVEGDAVACGGCFPQPNPERPTVVTDHRMILSVGLGKSTLYDQIRYTGSPADFAWVLPITGEVELGISSDELFAGLDAFTATAIFGPPQNCPPRPEGCASSSCASSDSLSAAGFEEGAPNGGVTVTKQEVIGPYATVQLQSNDADALKNWLNTNGYALPPDVAPIVDQYVKEKFNFLALRLKPGANVQSMRPVRVTSKGPNVVLPLRMVAAGAGANVGITLFTVAEGRYEPQNFPWFRIADTELEWDWTTSSSTFVEVRGAKNREVGGAGWEIEASVPLTAGRFPLPAPNGFGPPPAPNESLGYEATDTMSLRDVIDTDIIALHGGRVSGSISRLTRMRADLSRAALSEDLVLSASPDQAQLSNVRQVTREKNEPQCTVWVGCEASGTAPRSEAIIRSSDHCSTAGTAIPQETYAAAGIGLVALGLVRARRRRR